MRTSAFFLLTMIAAFGAEDSWKKVKDLKTGTEIRLFKKGSMKPVVGTIDEADDERIVVVVKNEQSAVPKSEIDRLDARAPKTGGTFKKESKTTSSVDAQPAPKGAPGSMDANTSSSSTSYTINGKPDFETLYRRPPVAPK